MLLRYLYLFIKPHRFFLYSLLGCAFLWGVLLSLTPYALKVIIDTLNANKSAHLLVIPAAAYAALWCLEVINFRLVDWLRLRFFPAVRQNITNTFFSYLNRHDYQYFQNQFAGALSNKIADMSGSVVSILMKVEEAFAQLCGLVIAAIMMYLVNPIFCLILIAWTFIFLLISASFSRKIHDLSNSFSETKSSLMGKVVDSLANIINIKSFAIEQDENQRIAAEVGITVTKDRAMQWQILFMRLCQDMSFIVLICAMLFSLIALYGKGQVTVGDFVLILTLSLSISQAMWWLASQLVQFAEELGRCTQALSIMTEPHALKDNVEAKALTVTNGEICFNHVSFQYHQGLQLFQDKTIKIAAGEKVGLVGFSGSGKSSFVNLIMRFFDIDSGEILIDNQDISTVTQHSLHRAITYIPQEATLFHRSLKENIRIGQLDASNEQIIEVAKKAYCHEFIEKLIHGYDTLVGERGIKLSGGQRQRIAIARAFLKNSPILILDEATSALDSVTESHIQQSLNSLITNRTTIIIAHRLSTLASVDRIFVFSEGNIIEQGTHQDLLKLNGHYAKMWAMQAGGFLPENETTTH
jgi:ATP-binding cassette, subfamily B, bacterial